MNGVALGGADGFAQDGAGSGFAKTTLDLVEVGELAEDPGDEARGLVLGFEKFPPDVGVAAHEGDVVFAFGPRGVGAVAVALDDGGVRGSAWIAVEEVGNGALVTTFASMTDDASARDVGDPEVAGFGFAVTGLEIVNGVSSSWR